MVVYLSIFIFKFEFKDYVYKFVFMVSYLEIIKCNYETKFINILTFLYMNDILDI